MKISTLIKKISVSILLISIIFLSFGSKISFAAAGDLGGQCSSKGYLEDSNGNEITPHQSCVQVNTGDLKFTPPTLASILTFAIRMIFIVGGLAALVMLLLGAFSWITSGGEKDKVEAAQKKITAAVLGVIMIAVVLAVVVTLEQVVFAGKICLGLTCGITIPSLVK